MDYLLPLLERVERVERCKRPWMWGIEKDRGYAGCFSTRDRGLGGYQNIRGSSRSCCPSIQDLDDERKSLDATEPNAIRWQYLVLGIQTNCSSYPYKNLLRSPRPPRYNLNSKHDVTLHPDKRPHCRPWKLLLK